MFFYEKCKNSYINQMQGVAYTAELRRIDWILSYTKCNTDSCCIKPLKGIVSKNLKES